MIPTVLLFGMLVALVTPRSRVAPVVLAGVVAALVWGALVATDGRLLTGFLGGAALAVPNFVVGALVGRVIRSGVSSAEGLSQRTQAG